MRTYGNSPLYNYVELVFRSKRLFIGSIILASLTTTFFYLYHAGSYSAHTLVLLTGTQTPTPSEDSRGTIQFKLSILNLALRDPNFVKQALKDDRLDEGMTGEQFDKFAKEARDKISYAVSDNVLEISCTWPDARAPRIVSAIYGAYSRTVIAEETFVSQTNQNLVQKLLTDYRNKRNTVELEVAKYQHDHALEMEQDPGPAAAQYQQSKIEVAHLLGDRDRARQKYALLQEQFKTTPENYRESTVYIGAGKDPTYVTAQTDQVAAKKQLDDLLLKYTPKDPRVKAAQQKLDDANANLKRLQPGATNPDKKGAVANMTETKNPEWLRLNNEIKQANIDMQTLDKQVIQAQKALQTAEIRAKTAPRTAYNFRRMTDNLNIYAGIEQSLAVKLESATMDEERDKAYKEKDMKVMVQPEAEQESRSARSLIVLAAGPLIGIIVAFCFSLLSETMDHSLRTPLDVEQQLGKPVLAVLPRNIPPRKGASRQLPGEAARPSLPTS